MIAIPSTKVHQKSFCVMYYNLEKVVEELMEDMHTYTDTTDPDESDSSADDVEPTWEPEKREI